MSILYLILHENVLVKSSLEITIIIIAIHICIRFEDGY